MKNRGENPYLFGFAANLLSRFLRRQHEINREASNNPNYGDAGGSEKSNQSSSSDIEAQMTQKSSELMEEEVLMTDSAPIASNAYPAPDDDCRHGDDGSSLCSLSTAGSGSSRLTGTSLKSEVHNLYTCRNLEFSKVSRFPSEDSSYRKGESSRSLSFASSSGVTKEMELPIHNITDAQQTMNSVTVDIPLPSQHTEPSQIRSETLGDKDVAIKVLTIGCAMALALLTFHKSINMNLAMRLSIMPVLIGITALLIGFFLHKEYPDYSDKTKLIGFGGVFIGFFGIIGAFLGLSFLSLIPLFCAIVTVILLGFVWVKKL